MKRLANEWDLLVKTDLRNSSLVPTHILPSGEVLRVYSVAELDAMSYEELLSVKEDFPEWVNSSEIERRYVASREALNNAYDRELINANDIQTFKSLGPLLFDVGIGVYSVSTSFVAPSGLEVTKMKSIANKLLACEVCVEALKSSAAFRDGDLSWVNGADFVASLLGENAGGVVKSLTATVDMINGLAESESKLYSLSVIVEFAAGYSALLAPPGPSKAALTIVSESMEAFQKSADRQERLAILVGAKQSTINLSYLKKFDDLDRARLIEMINFNQNRLDASSRLDWR